MSVIHRLQNSSAFIAEAYSVGLFKKIVTFKILSQLDSARVILVPLRQFVLSEEVLVVEQ